MSGMPNERYQKQHHGSRRRDFLILSTVSIGTVGTALAAWPFIDSMNPSADVVAMATTEVDISEIQIGQRITVVWRGRPVFIVRRTPDLIEQARADDDADLPHPQMDSERFQRSEWLVVVGVCTHLGCIPLGQKSAQPKGDYGGWFCPCHGSHYDTSGRIRRGPAPRNLEVPPHTFTELGTIAIG